MECRGLPFEHAATVCLCLLSGAGDTATGHDGGPENADELFRSGHFVAAKEVYRAALTNDGRGYHALLRLGETALLSNDLDEAERFLARARALRPDEQRPTALLAETYYRRDNFKRAAPFFREIGKTALAEKLASFADETPCEIVSNQRAVRLSFLLTDPLPLVQARVNGREANLLIDTGAAELILDPGFTERVGGRRFGAEEGVGAADQRIGYEHARVDTLALGELVLRNIPVHLLDTSRFSMAAGGRRVDGIIGTVLLYHFLATLDYPAGELVLRRPIDETIAHVQREADSNRAIVVPFWMAGDHYMVAWGRVNRCEPCLMFLDTGLAGTGFTCPRSTITAAGIALPEQSFQGVGGGGPISVTPFVVNELSLGDAKRSGVTGLFGTFPSSLEYGHGFRIGGLVSHSFLRPFAVTFDFTSMRLYLTREP